MSRVKPEDIDALLPQTQCGLCGYGGCMPYAEAIVFENAPLNLCPPGGCATLKSLGKLLDIDITPALSAMAQKEKSQVKAVIREKECIGCTKCITACPVDAIVGAAKQMHTVLSDLCTGCELCIPPCPVDCIDLIASPKLAEFEEGLKRNFFRQLHQDKQQRLAKEKHQKTKKDTLSIDKRKQYIQQALARARFKK